MGPGSRHRRPLPGALRASLGHGPRALIAALLLAGCTTREQRALELPAATGPATWIVGMFNRNALARAVALDAADATLPFWAEGELDEVEALVLGSSAERLNIELGELLVREPDSRPVVAVSTLLERVDPANPPSLSRWRAGEAGFSRAPLDSMKPGLLSGLLRVRSSCPPASFRVLSSTSAVELEAAVVVESRRALIAGRHLDGRAAVGFASPTEARWLGSWPETIVGATNGLGARSLVLVARGADEYALIELAYDGTLRTELITPLGTFSSVPRLAGLRDERLMIYTGTRVLNTGLRGVVSGPVDETESWPPRPRAIAIVGEPGVPTPIRYAIDEDSAVWRDAGEGFVREDLLDEVPETDYRLVSGPRIVLALSPTQVFIRERLTGRWRPDDPTPGLRKLTAVAVGGDRALLLSEGQRLHRFDGAAWCEVGGGERAPLDLLSSAPAGAFARVREGATWRPAWIDL